MHVGRFDTIKEGFLWTMRETAIFVVWAAIPTVLWVHFGQEWMALPWQPIALVGTAVAFVGFKNNAACARWWEARQIDGSIVNLSRTWAVQVLDFVSSSTELKRSADARYLNFYDVTEWKTELPAQLEGLIDDAELQKLLTTKNRATHILAMSRTIEIDLRELLGETPPAGIVPKNLILM